MRVYYDESVSIGRCYVRICVLGRIDAHEVVVAGWNVADERLVRLPRASSTVASSCTRAAAVVATVVTAVKGVVDDREHVASRPWRTGCHTLVRGSDDAGVVLHPHRHARPPVPL